MSAPIVFNEKTTAEQAAAHFAPEIKGKTVLITGVSQGGLGAEAARVIAKNGAALVVLAGRNQAKLDETTVEIRKETPEANLRSLVLDLQKFDSVRTAAAEVLAYREPIDVLINNAAIMSLPTYTVLENTTIEAQFGTNYLGHFLFTNLIRPRIIASASPRIVNVSSAGHRFSPVRLDDLNFSDGKEYTPWKAYGQSKSANMLFSVALADRWKADGVTAFSLHPGRIHTNLMRHMSIWSIAKAIFNLFGERFKATFSSAAPKPIHFKTIPEGTATHIVAAFDLAIAPESGGYLCDAHLANDAAEPYALDKEKAAKLWSLSEDLLGQKFD